MDYIHGYYSGGALGGTMASLQTGPQASWAPWDPRASKDPKASWDPRASRETIKKKRSLEGAARGLFFFSVVGGLGQGKINLINTRIRPCAGHLAP